jgi:eukaryotic-like serine/threonine-protein kinase
VPAGDFFPELIVFSHRLRMKESELVMKDLDAIYFAARGLPLGEQAAYLAKACAGDEALRARVERMLAMADEAEAFITDLPDDAPAQRRAGREPAPTSTVGRAETLEDMVGQKIGRYKILERVGEGGCGVVYVAEQTEPVRRRVALKVIKLGLDTREVIARFEAERQALAMMDHPNIAKVLDAGATESGRPYFVMELVRAMKITDCCDQANFSTNERLDLFIKVCHAIQHAHQKGIIHRDIKPSNILVTLHDGVPVPKVIDFGIAKATEGRLTDGTVYTQLHQFIGTPAYMSPEQAEMSGLDIDTRSDIYSLGVLLYELLTGNTPFDGKELILQGIDAMRKTIREKEPVRPSTKLSQTLVAVDDGTRKSTSGLAIPTQEEARAASHRRLRLKEQIARVKGDLDWVVMKCLEKDRSRRYETAIGLAQDLKRHLNNEPVSAGPPSGIYALKKFVVRNKWPVILAVTVTALILTGLVGTSIGLQRATTARVQADENARRAGRSADQARKAEKAARHQAYSATMVSASDALARAQIDTARLYLDRAPSNLRGWEWRHLSSRLDVSMGAHLHPRSKYGKVLVMPDGRSYYDLCGEPTKGIRRWDTGTGQLLSTLPTSHAYWQGCLMAGGRRLIAQVYDENRPGGIEVWDLERETMLSFFPLGNIKSPCAMNGSKVAYRENDQLWLMDVETGLKTLVSPVMDSPEVSFQPGGRRLAFCPTWEEVALLDLESLKVVARFKGHKNQISCMAFSADGRWLATGSLDNTIRITDVAVDPPAMVATLHGHTDWVMGLCFSPDGARLSSCGRDRTLRLWDPHTGRCENVLASDSKAPSFLPDGRTLIGPEENGIRFWDVKSLDVWVLRGHRSYIYPVLLSPDGATIYSGGWDGYYGQPGSLRFWDAATGEAIAATLGSNEYVRAAALSKDGSRLAISICPANSSPSRIDILDTATAMTVASVTNLTDDHSTIAVESLTFDPAGENVVWIEQKHATARMADARTGRLLKTSKVCPDHGGLGYSRVAWSPDGATIAAYLAGDPSVYFLDAHSLEPVRHWPHRHSEWVCSLAFSPDSKRILTASEDGNVRVWDVATGTRLHDLVGHGSRVLCAAYSPDGKRIASGGADQNVRLWDAETFEPVATLSGHKDYVYSLVWRADSQQIISGSGDNTVRIWDTQPLTGRLEARRERQAILVQVEPMVRRLFTELGDANNVVERVRADATLGPRERQVALRTSIDRQKMATP